MHRDRIRPPKSECPIGQNRSSVRINSQILPIKTHPEVGYDLGDLPGGEQIVDQFRRCGEFARANGLRITFHPDQNERLEVLSALTDHNFKHE